MEKPCGRVQIHAGACLRTLLLAIAASSLSACNRPPDLPSPPHSPSRPETQIHNLVISGMRRALFSYSTRPDAFHRIEPPLVACHPAVTT